jgi:hypothetical protein
MDFLTKIIFNISILALSLTFTHTSEAGSFHTGETLLQMCENRTDRGFEIACDGYIVGVFDTWMESSGAATVVIREYVPSAEFTATRHAVLGFCIETRTSIHQLSAIVVSHLKANPKTWQEPASFLIREALIDAFPCKR